MGAGKPSKRQAEILHFVRKFQREKGYSPSLGEIAGHFKVSIPTVHQHIAHLRKKSLLAMEKGFRSDGEDLEEANARWPLRAASGI